MVPAVAKRAQPARRVGPCVQRASFAIFNLLFYFGFNWAVPSVAALATVAILLASCVIVVRRGEDAARPTFIYGLVGVLVTQATIYKPLGHLTFASGNGIFLLFVTVLTLVIELRRLRGAKA